MKKVICVGDSIRMGYEPTVVTGLTGCANVIEMGGIQGGNTRNVIAHLHDWVIEKGPQIIHINAGLHDMARKPGPGPENAVPIDEYRANLEQILTTLQNETNAVIIFALTTPVNLNRQLAIAKAVNRTSEDVANYNETALLTATKFAIAVNDLHRVVVDYGADDLLADDGVHFTTEGYDILGRAVAETIRHAV